LRRQTGMLLASSIVSLLASLAVAKVVSYSFGLDAYADVALYAVSVQFGVLVFSGGVPTALITQASPSLTVALGPDDDLRGSRLHVDAWRAAARRLTLAACLVVMLAAVAVAGSGEWRLAGVPTLLIGFGVVAGTVGGYAAAELNLYQLTRDLAVMTAAAAVSGALAQLAVLWIWQLPGLLWSLAANAAVTLIVTVALTHRAVPRMSRRGERPGHPDRTRHLLRTGLPFSAANLYSTGVQYLLPLVVLAVLGRQSLGLYRSVTTITVIYMSVMLSTFAATYLPALSRADDGVVSEVVARQSKVVFALSTPVILVLFAVAPFVLRLLYAKEFEVAAPLLRWQLLGDLIRLSAWLLGYVVLAKRGGRLYTLTEAVGGSALLVGTYLGVRLHGLDGAGIGFLAAYVVYFVTVLLASRRALPGQRWVNPWMAGMLVVAVLLGVIRGLATV